MIERLQSTFVLAVLLAVAWLTGESASAATVVAWRLNQDGRIALYTWERLPDEVIVYSGAEPTCTTRALGRAEEVFELTVTDDDPFTAPGTVVIINKLLQDLLAQARGE